MSLAPPSGSRDFLPQELRRRERALARVARTFALHGFEPVATPAFERIDTLSGKYGEEGDKLIFRILKRGPRAAAGEADLALRYDLTVPGARVYAHRRGELPRVFKRYQIGPVWRGERPGKGRFREFTQCDVDIFGAESRLADVAVIVALAAALDALGVHGATVRLNSRAVLAATMESYGVPSGMRAGALTSLDKLDKIGVDGVAEELRERGVPYDAADALRRDVGGGEFAAALRRRLADSSGGAAGLAEVDAVLERAAPRLSGGARIVFDPALARGLDYYTGPIFEFAAEGGGASIAGGGRYDDLCGQFVKDRVPVCGGSLGIERILSLLEVGEAAAEPRVYVAVWDDEGAGRALDLAAEIRAAGVAAETDLTGARLGRQFKTADERGCRFVVVEGPDEIAAGAVALKDLADGSQSRAPREAVAAEVARRLACGGARRAG